MRFWVLRGLIHNLATRRVVGADTYTPLAGASFRVIPSEADIVTAGNDLAAGR